LVSEGKEYHPEGDLRVERTPGEKLDRPSVVSKGDDEVGKEVGRETSPEERGKETSTGQR
jgi:hypothetical protein